MSDVFVPMSSSTSDKDCSTNISSLDFSMEEEFVSMSLDKGFPSTNSSRDFFVEEESTSDSTPDKGSPNFS